ncbi:MAG TPA: transglutaminase-like domain-containing protein [Ramlibacter sp.]
MSYPVEVSDDPSDWMDSTRLIDLHDTKLRLRAQSLTQLARTEREKALAIYSAVKRIPFAKPMKLRLRTAHETLRLRHADAEDKATLFVGLLRAARFPARVCYVELHGAILRGLTRAIASAGRPVVQVWFDDRWRSTDTYIFDAHYIAAARARLRALKWDWGYGLHRRGHALWDGMADAHLGGDEQVAGDISLGVLGWFHDPYDFLVSPVCRERFPRLPRAVRWNVLAPGMNRAVNHLRDSQPGGGSPSFGAA